MVAEESRRLARLVDDLLDFSRLQVGAADPEVDWVSLEELVRTAFDSLPAPPGGFDVTIDEGLPLVRADAAQLERALVNLLENAARYPAGRVAARSRHDAHPPAPPSCPRARSGDRSGR